MKKHGRQQRQLGALIRIYRTLTPWFMEFIRDPANRERLGMREEQYIIEVLALESRLPPEMVAWARMNR